MWQRTSQAHIEDEIMKRRWRWIGHTIRRPHDSITRQVLKTEEGQAKKHLLDRFGGGHEENR